MGPIYHALGLSVAVIQSKGDSPDPDSGSFMFDPAFQSADSRFQGLRPCKRRDCYLADITYGTNNEYGFDYLRDNMVYDKTQMVQREELYFAIVDEVDNILIDEARTPLRSTKPVPLSSSPVRQMNLPSTTRNSLNWSKDSRPVVRKVSIRMSRMAIL